MEGALVEHFGRQPQRASVSFVGVEPIDVLRFQGPGDEWCYASLGMSRHPMTAVNEAVQRRDGPRAELMLRLRDPLYRFAEVWRQLALLAAAPAVEGVVYAANMSVDLGQPLAAGSLCTGVLVRESALAPIQTDVGPVTVLQVFPATATELAWCRVRGGPALAQRWSEAGTDLSDLGRSPVELE